jgi:putative membrane protein
MMWWHFGWPGWGMMGLGILWMVIVWGAIIALIVWGIRRLGRTSYRTDTGSPLDIARERYAKGEITREQFEQIKKDLMG